jgi:hypothetical protein
MSGSQRKRTGNAAPYCPTRSRNLSGAICPETGLYSLNAGTIRRPEPFIYKQVTPVDLIHPPGTADLAMPCCPRPFRRARVAPVETNGAAQPHEVCWSPARENPDLLSLRDTGCPNRCHPRGRGDPYPLGGPDAVRPGREATKGARSCPALGVDRAKPPPLATSPPGRTASGPPAAPALSSGNRGG